MKEEDYYIIMLLEPLIHRWLMIFWRKLKESLDNYKSFIFLFQFPDRSVVQLRRYRICGCPSFGKLKSSDKGIDN